MKTNKCTWPIEASFAHALVLAKLRIIFSFYSLEDILSFMCWACSTEAASRDIIPRGILQAKSQDGQSCCWSQDTRTNPLFKITLEANIIVSTHRF
jgi:hypothetical protein